jgi:hypothetical protein
LVFAATTSDQFWFVLAERLERCASMPKV